MMIVSIVLIFPGVAKRETPCTAAPMLAQHCWVAQFSVPS